MAQTNPWEQDWSTPDRAPWERDWSAGPSPAPEPEERGLLRGAADLALGVGRGAVQGVRMLSDVAGADNAASTRLRSVDDYLGELQSATVKRDEQEVSRILKDAESDGILDQVIAGAKAFAVAPGQMIAQAAGTMLPTVAAAFVPGLGPAALAGRVAPAVIGAAQGVGNIKGNILESVEAELIASGVSPEEARQRAIEQQSYGSDSTSQMALGGALGVLAGGTGAERAVQVLRSGASKAPRGLLGRTLAGGAVEAIPEGLQGGQEKYATNDALNDQGLTRDPWAGVVAGATMEAMAAAPLGAATSIPKPRMAATPGEQLADALDADIASSTWVPGGDERAALDALKPRRDPVDAVMDPTTPIVPGKILDTFGITPVGRPTEENDFAPLATDILGDEQRILGDLAGAGGVPVDRPDLGRGGDSGLAPLADLAAGDGAGVPAPVAVGARDFSYAALTYKPNNDGTIIVNGDPDTVAALVPGVRSIPTSRGILVGKTRAKEVAAAVDAMAPVPESFGSEGEAAQWATKQGLDTAVQPAQTGDSTWGLVPIPKQKTVGELREQTESIEGRLNGAIQRVQVNATGKPVEIVPDAELVGPVGRAAAVFARGYEAVTGTPVVFARNTTANGALWEGRIVLDVARLERAGGNVPGVLGDLLKTAFHEATHDGEQSPDPVVRKAYSDLKDIVLSEMVDPNAVAKRQVWEQKLSNRDITPEYAGREIVADLGGEFMFESRFWGRAYDIDKGSTARSVFYKFMQASTKVIALLHGAKLDTSIAVKNRDRVREAYVQAWAERAGRRDAGKGVPGTPPTGAPPVDAAAPPASDQQAPAPPAGQVLQNRDRSTPGAIAQMQSIAKAPDYARLGFSRDFAAGAPVVSGGQIPAAQLGRADTASAGERRIPVQYAVVEAADVLASNDAMGGVNKDYAGATERIRAIAGNGRIAGLQAAYLNTTAAQKYRGEMEADTLHGIDPAVIRKMTNPVLVRVMPASEVTADIGDVSNIAAGLSMTAVEQAKNDARRVNLDALDFSDGGDATPQSVRKFVQAMPQSEQGGLIDTDGSPTRQAIDRLNAAIFASAYKSDALVRLYAQATDPEARNVMSALAQAAPSMARLEGAGALDIREIVTQAAEQAVNARRRGIKLADMAAQADLDADPATQVVLGLFAANPRAVKPIVDSLRRAADFAYAESTKDGADMFGAVERASRADVLDQLRPANERASEETLADQAGRKPAGQDADGRGAKRDRQAAAEEVEAGRPAPEEGGLKFAQAPPTNTPAFKRWFGDSKVVDADGKPLVVYHGTANDFGTFESRERYPSKKLYVDGKFMPRVDSWDMGNDSKGTPDGIHYGAWTDALTIGVDEAIKFREREGAAFGESADGKRHLADLRRLKGKGVEWRDEAHATGDGFYFSPSPNYAVAFSGRDIPRDGGNMMPVYLSIKNPIYLDAGGIEVAGMAQNVAKYMKQGYDGAIFVENKMFGDGRLPLEQDRGSYSAQIVAFRPEQIKSAIGNTGAFDPEKPDIRFSQPDPYAAYDGIQIRQPVLIEDTGQTAYLRLDAGRALRSLDERMETFRKTLDCLSR